MTPEQAWKRMWEAGLHTKEEARERALFFWDKEDGGEWVRWSEITNVATAEKQEAERHLRRIMGVPHKEQLSWVLGDYRTEIAADRHLSFIWRDVVLATVPAPVAVSVLAEAQGRSDVPSAWLGPQGAIDHELHRTGLSIEKRKREYEFARARGEKDRGDGEGISVAVGVRRYSVWDFVDTEEEWEHFGCLTEVVGLRQYAFCEAEKLIPLLRSLPEGCEEDLFWKRVKAISWKLKR